MNMYGRSVRCQRFVTVVALCEVDHLKKVFRTDKISVKSHAVFLKSERESKDLSLGRSATFKS